jgi:hypothetical protein
MKQKIKSYGAVEKTDRLDFLVPDLPIMPKTVLVVVLSNCNVAAIMEDRGDGTFEFNYNSGNIARGRINYEIGTIVIETYRWVVPAHIELEVTCEPALTPGISQI